MIKNIYRKLVDRAAKDKRFLQFVMMFAFAISCAMAGYTLYQEHPDMLVHILFGICVFIWILLVGLFVGVPIVIEKVFPQITGEVWFYTFIAFLFTPLIIG